MVRLQIMFNIGNSPGRFIAGPMNHLAVELRQGRCHILIPAGLIAGLSQLFQNNEVAPGPSSPGKGRRKRFVLSDRDGLRACLGPSVRFVLAVGAHRFFTRRFHLL